MKAPLICIVLLATLTTSCGPQNNSSASPLPGTQVGPFPGGGNQNFPVQLDAEEANFVTLINNYRVQNGLPALKVSISLTQASQWMSQDMASHDYLDHTDSLGRDPGTRIADFGYTGNGYWGENIAAGNASAQDTFTQWKNSPPHNANMLGANYFVIGVGRAYNASSSYGWYWTTDFGSTVDATLP